MPAERWDTIPRRDDAVALKPSMANAFLKEHKQTGGRRHDDTAARTCDGSVSESRVEAFARHAREQPQLVAQRGGGADWMFASAGTALGRAGISLRQHDAGEKLRGWRETIVRAFGNGWPTQSCFGPGFSGADGNKRGVYHDRGRRVAELIEPAAEDREAFDPHPTDDQLDSWSEELTEPHAPDGADEYCALEARANEAIARKHIDRAHAAVLAQCVTPALGDDMWRDLLAVCGGDYDGNHNAPINCEALARALDIVADACSQAAARRGRGRPKKYHKITVTNADFSNHIYMGAEAGIFPAPKANQPMAPLSQLTKPV
jgi:hypothetical protein